MSVDTDKAPRIAFNLTNARVQHYSDVVEYLVQAALRKCQEEGWTPSQSEIQFFRKQVIRYAVIRQDVDAATRLTLKRQTLLNE